jgi:hypothetical protein
VESVLGLPYGFHNFLFGWIDTPEENLPPPATLELVVVLLPVLDKARYPYSSSLHQKKKKKTMYACL